VLMVFNLARVASLSLVMIFSQCCDSRPRGFA